MKVGLAQIAPVWLDREQTVARVEQWVRKAAEASCQLVAFGETLIPGYPFWTEHTGGASFNDDLQKDLFAHYIDQAVVIDRGDLAPIQAAAKEHSIVVMVGCYERALDRGGHTGYCSLVTIDANGDVTNAHRKVMPTYEERLVWGIGDGHGLKVFPLGDFTVSGLNCWENWLPLLRATLHAQGSDLHVAVWPGSQRNTEDITRFLAMEARSYILSVSGLLTRSDIPDTIPHASLLKEKCPETMANGGSCIAAPDGTWIVSPSGPEPTLMTAELDHAFVRRERHNLDISGHYSRPDIVHLQIDTRRQGIVPPPESSTT
ncbi:MAG: carbon-nitrogen hydrolase family protein [Planctomycetota bacterium]